MIDQKLGIRISYNPTESFGYQRLLVTIKVDTGAPSKNFITSPEIRDAIKQARLKPGHPFGKISYSYKAGVLECGTYIPYPQKGVKPDEKFEKKGIATRIENRAIDKALEVFPKVKSIEHGEPQDFRKNQLLRIGFTQAEISGRMRFDKYRTTLRAHSLKNIRTRRK